MKKIAIFNWKSAKIAWPDSDHPNPSEANTFSDPNPTPSEPNRFYDPPHSEESTQADKNTI